MKLGRVAAVLAVLAALALAAVATARHYLHPARLAAALAEQVRKSSGRELVIGRAAELTLFPRPAIVLEDVRFGNAAWGSQPWMASVGRAEADMQWGPLLRGEIDIASIHLAGAALLLETDAAGNGNWVMGAPDSAPIDLSWLTGFAVAELRIEPFAVAYRDGATGDTIRVALESVTLEAPAAPQPIRFRTHGRYSGKRFEAQGSIGALAALLAGDRPYPLTLSANSGNSKLHVSGQAGQPLQLAGLSLDVSAQGAALADLEVLFPRELGPRLAERDREGHLPGLAYRLGWHLAGDWNAFSLSGMNIVAGDPERMEFRARGSMELRQSGSQPFQLAAMDLELQARGREIRELLALAGESIPPAGPYDMSARLSGSWDAPALAAIKVEVGSPERIHLTARGALTRPREPGGFDMEIAALAKHPWRLSEEASAPLLPPFRLRTRVRDRPAGYALDNLELEVAGSRVDATVVASRRGQRLHIAARAASPLIDLAQVLTEADAAARSAREPARDGKGSAGESVLGLADVDLDLQVGKLRLGEGRSLTGISGHFALTPEGLAIRAGRVTAGGGKLRLEGSVAHPGRGAGIDLTVGIQGEELAELLTFAGRPIPPVGPYRATARALGSLEALRLDAIKAQAGQPGQTRLRAKGQIADARKWEGVNLALAADIPDPALLSRLAGRELPRLPPVKLSANLSRSGESYALDDLSLALGRSQMQGRIAVEPAEPRPRISASLTGPMLDLSEIRPPRGAQKALPEQDGNPLQRADMDAEIRLERVVLPDKRALGPVSGRILLSAGTLELRQLAVSVDGASAVAEGTVANALEPSGLDLAVKVDVQRSAALAAFAGIDLPKLPPFKASGRLSDVPDGYTVSGLRLAFASTTASGDLAVTRAASRYSVRATLASPLIDVSEFLPEPHAAKGEPATPAGGRVFSDAPLPFASLRVVDADLDLRVDKLRYRDIPPLGPVVARVALAGGRLQADRARIGDPGGEYIEFSATVDAAPGRKAGVALRAEGRSVNLGGVVSRAERFGTMTGGATDFKLDLTSRGDSAHALMAGLNGSAMVKVGPARIHHASFDLGTGIILRVLDLINPFRKSDPDTDVKCIAVRVPIAAGVITSDRRIAIETAKFHAVATGTVDLGTETLALAVTPAVSQGIALGTGQLLGDVRVGGTLRNPDIGLDSGLAGTAKSVVSVYADVATAGGWLLADALLKKARTDPRPCATALDESR